MVRLLGPAHGLPPFRLAGLPHPVDLLRVLGVQVGMEIAQPGRADGDHPVGIGERRYPTVEAEAAWEAGNGRGADP
jgi:hypothetical protein